MGPESANTQKPKPLSRALNSGLIVPKCKDGLDLFTAALMKRISSLVWGYRERNFSLQ